MLGVRESEESGWGFPMRVIRKPWTEVSCLYGRQKGLWNSSGWGSEDRFEHPEDNPSGYLKNRVGVS